MIQKFYFILFLTTISCSHQSANTRESSLPPRSESRYIWKKVLDSAAWRKNYNFQLFSIRDTLWTCHPDGNWFSTNGNDWKKSDLPNAIGNLAFLDYVPFHNSLYGLGHFEGNIERFTFQPQIYRTENFKSWKVLTRASNLPARFFYHPFVFKDKIWMIGGEDKSGSYSDIWNSADGVTWVKQRDDAGVGKRSGSQIVLLGNKLFLLDNDVWSSEDGLNWVQVTNEIVPGEKIFGYAAVVWDDQIWLLGCNRNGQFSSQVLVSKDGQHWTGQDAPWSPRGGVAATVYKGKIYMTGGKYGGTPNQPDFRYSNDLWTLEVTH